MAEIQAGNAPNAAALCSSLREASGIGALEATLSSLFAGRRDVLKARVVLVRLDDVAVRTQLRRVKLRLVRQTTLQARLESERLGQRELRFPASVLQDIDDPGGAISGRSLFISGDQKSNASCVCGMVGDKGFSGDDHCRQAGLHIRSTPAVQ